MWKLIIQYGIQLLLLIFKNKFEKNAEKKEQQEKVIKQVKDGIKKKDNSKITAGFSKLKKNPSKDKNK